MFLLGLQPEEPEWDEFGNDLYDIPEALPVQSSNQVVNISPPNIVDEENKIKAFVDTSALDWQRWDISSPILPETTDILSVISIFDWLNLLFSGKYKRMLGLEEDLGVEWVEEWWVAGEWVWLDIFDMYCYFYYLDILFFCSSAVHILLYVCMHFIIKGCCYSSTALRYDL